MRQQLKPRFFPVAAVTAAVLVAGLLAGCTSPADNPTIQSSPAPADTTSPTRVAASSFTTIQSAEAYVQAKAGDAGGPFEFIGADSTWRSAATLHVIHATPTTSASYGGDHYFFFVNGNPVGQFFFTATVSDHAPDDTSYAVTYRAFNPGDPHCCPTGGTAITTFRWDGSTLSHDPTPGATQN
jgi:hypothetical protein